MDLNTHWKLGMLFNSFNLFTRNVSHSLDNPGNSDMGLYDVTCSVGYCGFFSIIISTVLKHCGILALLELKSNIKQICYHDNLTTFFGNSLRSPRKISSIPGALFGVMFVPISLATSIGVLKLNCLGG